MTQACLCSCCLNEIRGLQSRVRSLEEQVSSLQTDLRRFGSLAEPADEQSPSRSTQQACEGRLLDSLAVGFDDGQIGIASLRTRRVEMLSDAHHEDAVSCVHWSSSCEQLASACDDGKVMALQYGRHHQSMSRSSGLMMHHTEGRHFVDGVAALAVLVLDDGSVVSGAEDCNVKVRH